MDKDSKREIAQWKLSEISKEQFSSARIKLCYQSEELHAEKKDWQTIEAKLKGTNRTLAHTHFAKQIPLYLAGIVILSFLIHFSIPYVSSGAASLVPFRVEKEVVEFFLDDIENELYHDEKSIESLQKIITRLGEEKDHYKVMIWKTNMINAFALPARTIIVTTGLLAFLDDDEELTGIIAHELQHIKLNHHMAKLIKGQFIKVILAAISGGSSSTNLIQSIGTAKYGSEDESDADYQAALMLNDSKISSQGMINFLKRINEKHKDNILYKIALTHPDNESRMATMNKLSTIPHTKREILSKKEWDRLKKIE